MTRLFYLISTLFLLITFSGCGQKSSIDEKKFFDLYTEILIVRVAEPDTAIANPKVRDLFAKYNYSQEQFKSDFIKLSENNEQQSFAKKIDSLRQHIYSTPSPKMP